MSRTGIVRGYSGALDRHVRPMFLPGAPAAIQAFSSSICRGASCLPESAGGMRMRLVIAGDALDEFALVRLARHDRVMSR